MAVLLHGLGAWCYRKRRLVLGLWIAIVLLLGVASQTIGGSTDDAFSIPGTPSQEAQDLLEAKFPGTGGASARIVFAAPEGGQLSASREAVEESLADAVELDDVVAVSDPFASGSVGPDGRIGFADVTYTVPADELDADQRDALAAVADPALAAGLQVEFGGGLVTDQATSSTEALGAIVAFIVLALVLGSLTGAWLPLIVAFLAVATAELAITTLAGVVSVSSTASALAVMLGLAVGIDYSLFILSRYRSNLEEGHEPPEAFARASGTAGSAVFFAGLTVVIALVGLLVLQVPFLTSMGLGAAGTIVIAVAVALTLLPALVGFASGRLDPARDTWLNRRSKQKEGSESASRRWAKFVTVHPLPVLFVGAGLLLVVGLPALNLKLGLPGAGSQSTQTTERRAYDLLTEGFGPGFNGPFTVVANAPSEDADVVGERLAEGLEATPGIAAVGKPVSNEAGDVTIVTATPETGPDTDETKALVEQIRNRADEVEQDTGIDILVTGVAVINIDISDKLASALPLYMFVVVALALLLLVGVFRSLLIPVKAVLGFLLSLAAAMGAVVFIFQEGNLDSLFSVGDGAPVISFLPVLLIGILFGLAMDYEVFLVSRMRERYMKRGEPTEAVVTGMSQSGRVVGAAGIIMFAVFAGFIFGDDPIIKSFGLGLALGILADAFVVRMTLVPAVLALAGDRAWYLPRWLDRIIPDLDIEGEKLSHQLADPTDREKPDAN